jgi:hypothetical protein
VTEQPVAPAFYALRSGGWRDYVTVLHLPYTAWNLSYVAIGAALAPQFSATRLWLALAAFFLALGVSAHALDELNGRPLRTHIPSSILVALAAGTLAGSLAIGVYAAWAWGWWLLVFVAIGGLLEPAYNLEWLGGAIHNVLGLGVAWGAFPVLTAYFVEAQTIRIEAIGTAAFAPVVIVAQHTLSTPVRDARRNRQTLEGTAAFERALRLLSIAFVLLAVGLVTGRLT